MNRRDLLKSIGVAGIVGFTTKAGIEVFEDKKRELEKIRIYGNEATREYPDKFNELAERVEALEKAREIIS